MKKLTYFILAVFFAMLILTMAAIEKITFSGGEPLDAYQPSVIVPVLTEAFKRIGIKFNAEYYPGLRSLMMSNSGETDGELHRDFEFHKISENKYPNLIRIEAKLLSVWLIAFATKDIKIETWHDLKGCDVAYYRGRKNVENFLNNSILPDQIHATTTDEEAFRMLAMGRVDVVISEGGQGHKIIATNSRLSKCLITFSL